MLTFLGTDNGMSWLDILVCRAVSRLGKQRAAKNVRRPAWQPDLSRFEKFLNMMIKIQPIFENKLFFLAKKVNGPLVYTVRSLF